MFHNFPFCLDWSISEVHLSSNYRFYFGYYPAHSLIPVGSVIVRHDIGRLRVQFCACEKRRSGCWSETHWGGPCCGWSCGKVCGKCRGWARPVPTLYPQYYKLNPWTSMFYKNRQRITHPINIIVLDIYWFFWCFMWTVQITWSFIILRYHFFLLFLNKICWYAHSFAKWLFDDA